MEGSGTALRTHTLMVREWTHWWSVTLLSDFVPSTVFSAAKTYPRCYVQGLRWRLPLRRAIAVDVVSMLRNASFFALVRWLCPPCRWCMCMLHVSVVLASHASRIGHRESPPQWRRHTALIGGVKVVGTRVLLGSGLSHPVRTTSVAR